MNLESLTYRHVRVFLALYKSRSASRVAEELKMTNSAITRTIACLREIFSDQLFVRTNKALSVKITFATLSVLHGVVKHAIFAGVYR